MALIECYVSASMAQLATLLAGDLQVWGSTPEQHIGVLSKWFFIL
jgi:hypothetical protein